MELKPEYRKYLLELSRKSLEYYFVNGKNYDLNHESVPVELQKERATFVTITKEKKLRGCVGHLEPIYPLYKDVIENTYAAAFYDSRFYPLSEEELEQITIEISVLTIPKSLKFTSYNDLLGYMRAKRPGVIMSQLDKRATFLPQVWDELKDPDQFLTHLALKGGITLNKESPNFDIEIYQVEKFSETNED